VENGTESFLDKEKWCFPGKCFPRIPCTITFCPGETDADALVALARESNTAGAAVHTLGFGYDLDFGLLTELAAQAFGAPWRRGGG
jgi:hypothetical protein